MKNKPNRRDFGQQASLAAGGLLAGTWLGATAEAGENQDLSDKRLVLLGLNALARAHEFNYFNDGHRGASLVAAHLLCVDNQLDDRAASRIVKLFDLNWASQPLCKPFPEAEAEPAKIDKIGDALVEGGDVLRQVGHNAIFAMLAIKAFRLLPAQLRPSESTV